MAQIIQEKISVVSPSVLSESTIGTAMDVTTEVMMYGINLVVWGVLNLYFQVIERNHSPDPPAHGGRGKTVAGRGERREERGGSCLHTT